MNKGLIKLIIFEHFAIIGKHRFTIWIINQIPREIILLEVFHRIWIPCFHLMNLTPIRSSKTRSVSLLLVLSSISSSHCQDDSRFFQALLKCLVAPSHWRLCWTLKKYETLEWTGKPKIWNLQFIEHDSFDGAKRQKLVLPKL